MIANFDDIVKAVKARECILFLGAGAHRAPDDEDPEYAGSYPAADRPASVARLIEVLTHESQIKDDVEYSTEEREKIVGKLERISLYYEIAKSRVDLADKVRSEVSDNKQPSRALRALAALDFPIICTTNYDKLFERALSQAGKDPIVSSYSRESFAKTKNYPRAIPDPQRPFLFKIHGDVDDPTSIVITDEDYIQWILRMIWGVEQYDPIPAIFPFYMKFWPVLFIGFSLMDYNLRLLFKILGWNLPDSKQSYSVGPYPDGLIKKRYDPPVKFIVRDLWGFVPDLYQAVTGRPMP